MIRTFADKATQRLYLRGESRRLPPDMIRRALILLDQLDSSATVDDMRTPPGNRLHALRGNRSGQHAVRINDQWRLCFVFRGGDAYQVEIIDYH